MIMHEPETLNSFSRCECDYRLLEVGSRFAIEWAPWHEIPYAIMYDDQLDTLKDFEKLGKRQTSYQDIETKTSIENIVHRCPWLPGEKFIRVEKIGEDFWNVIAIHHGDEEVKAGPYRNLHEASQNLVTDYQESYGKDA